MESTCLLQNRSVFSPVTSVVPKWPTSAKKHFCLGRHNGTARQAASVKALWAGTSDKGLGDCLSASTVICRESMGHRSFVVSLLYGCPSYYFLLVWVLILHICEQLCSYAAVAPRRPYAFPCWEKIPPGVFTGCHRKRIIVVPKKNKNEKQLARKSSLGCTVPGAK